MISFKSFLAESRSAPLYHKTDLKSFWHIMKDGAIAPLTTHAGRSPAGVSLTRSIKTADAWRKFKAGIIIEIDQEKLIRNKRVKPINIANIWYPGSNYNAKYEELFEEYVKGPIESKYFKRFIVMTNPIKTSYNLIEESRYIRLLSEDFPDLKIYVWKDKKIIPVKYLEIDDY